MAPVPITLALELLTKANKGNFVTGNKIAAVFFNIAKPILNVCSLVDLKIESTTDYMPLKSCDT